MAKHFPLVSKMVDREINGNQYHQSNNSTPKNRSKKKQQNKLLWRLLCKKIVLDSIFKLNHLSHYWERQKILGKLFFEAQCLNARCAGLQILPWSLKYRVITHPKNVADNFFVLRWLSILTVNTTQITTREKYDGQKKISFS